MALFFCLRHFIAYEETRHDTLMNLVNTNRRAQKQHTKQPNPIQIVNIKEFQEVFGSVLRRPPLKTTFITVLRFTFHPFLIKNILFSFETCCAL